MTRSGGGQAPRRVTSLLPNDSRLTSIPASSRALRPVEEIRVGCPHDLHPGRVDKLAIKNVTGKGYVVVPQTGLHSIRASDRRRISV